MSINEIVAKCIEWTEPAVGLSKALHATHSGHEIAGSIPAPTTNLNQ